jgi:hypothetical protein
VNAFRTKVTPTLVNMKLTFGLESFMICEDEGYQGKTVSKQSWHEIKLIQMWPK